MQYLLLNFSLLQSTFQGDLLISISYSPRSYKLEGIVHKATGLRKLPGTMAGMKINLM